MSFARRALAVILAVQFLVIVREVVFEFGLDGFIDAMTSQPIFILVPLIAILDIALIVPVMRGNRWATLATIPLMVLLLFVALPVWTFVFPSPTSENFAVWFTLTVGVIASTVGIIFGSLATLESFGRRTVQTSSAPGFSSSSMFTVAVVAALGGMAVLAMAVAASPSQAGSVFDEPPNGYATITMRDLRFSPDDLPLPGGQTTAVFVTNKDAFDHSFDIDSADVHVTVAAGQTKVVMLSPSAGESMAVYCAVPGHRDGGMVGTVIGQ